MAYLTSPLALQLEIFTLFLLHFVWYWRLYLNLNGMSRVQVFYWKIARLSKLLIFDEHLPRFIYFHDNNFNWIRYEQMSEKSYIVMCKISKTKLVLDWFQDCVRTGLLTQVFVFTVVKKDIMVITLFKAQTIKKWKFDVMIFIGHICVLNNT